MPCTAKKWEIGRDETMNSSGYKDVDEVITTRELAKMIKAAGISFKNLKEEEADNPLGEYSGAVKPLVRRTGNRPSLSAAYSR